ncbi:MAG: hypothetical protein MZV49_20615 [Rhodopseudomonas palustris]|nr:hypothetical protein [Rhodopseudomonas palustris]
MAGIRDQRHRGADQAEHRFGNHKAGVERDADRKRRAEIARGMAVTVMTTTMVVVIVMLRCAMVAMLVRLQRRLSTGEWSMVLAPVSQFAITNRRI